MIEEYFLTLHPIFPLLNQGKMKLKKLLMAALMLFGTTAMVAQEMMPPIPVDHRR